MFSIRFTSHSAWIAHVTAFPRPCALGEVVIGAFRDVFASPLEVWKPSDYEAQWATTMHRLRTGTDKACFVTGVHPRHISRFVDVFGVWRLHDEYHFQQFVVACDTLSTAELLELHLKIKEYSRVTSEGDVIYDDWAVPVSDFADP
jgi:hypothetical protein